MPSAFCWRVSRIFHPCLLAAESTVRKTAKYFRSGSGAETARDFLLDLHHAHVLLGLIVGEGHAGIAEKAQHILLAALRAQE